MADFDDFGAATTESSAPAFQMLAGPETFLPVGQAANMLCCQCGSTIAPNPTSMCTQCLTARVDVTEGIATQVSSFRAFALLNNPPMGIHRCRCVKKAVGSSHYDNISSSPLNAAFFFGVLEHHLTPPLPNSSFSSSSHAAAASLNCS
jgi:hypothetical protein